MNIEFLNLLNPPLKKTVRKKKNRGDESIWAIIHIYMEVPQESPCVAILSKQKCHFVSFTKSENQRAEQVLPEGAGTSDRG
jgi:hypothetical protein